MIELTLSRHAMLATDLDVDCGSAKLAPFPAAQAACKQLADGKAPPAEHDEWLLALLMSSFEEAAPGERVFSFAQVDVPTVRLGQAQVHGLLGQRAVRPSQAGGGGGGGSGASVRATRTAAVGSPDREQSPGAAAAEAQGNHTQGEGFIDGHWLQYRVGTTSAGHGTHLHSRFECAPPRPTAPREV